VGGAGFEHPSQNSEKTTKPDERGAECGAPTALSTITDPDLRHLIEAWSSLPAAVRAGVVAIVRASVGSEKP